LQAEREFKEASRSTVAKSDEQKEAELRDARMKAYRAEPGGASWSAEETEEATGAQFSGTKLPVSGFCGM
jgi:hypothetical protein